MDAPTPPKRIWVWWTLENAEEEVENDLSDHFVGQAHATPTPECCGGGILVGQYVLEVRCGKCNACEIERIGCGCDGALDDGCFLCEPERHARPECPMKETT